MKIAIINEVSARNTNDDIVKALTKTNNTIFNVGMKNEEKFEVELTYIHTGLIAGILLNLGAVDMVVGGCGTGQGFLLSAMQYPKVACGLIIDPLDAWLFSQINGGNCISLAFKKGYGWAGDINLDYIFEKLFKDKMGNGYPLSRQASQKESREKLSEISVLTHKDMKEILKTIDKDITKKIFSHKPFVDLIKGEVKNKDLQKYILKTFLGENK